MKLEYKLDRQKSGQNVYIVSGAYFNSTEESTDGVYNYARVLCHYGALIMEFRDAWAEGEQQRTSLSSLGVEIYPKQCDEIAVVKGSCLLETVSEVLAEHTFV